MNIHISVCVCVRVSALRKAAYLPHVLLHEGCVVGKDLLLAEAEVVFIPLEDFRHRHLLQLLACAPICTLVYEALSY
jgi:hypothetical protein